MYTFLLTAYRPKYLRTAISSILAQTHQDFKLIIVDDASPDDLKSIVDEFDDPRISFHRHTENTGGKSLARHWNNCLLYVTTEFVILSSDDDVYESTFLSEINRLICKYPNIDIAGARIQFIGPEGLEISKAPILPEYLSPKQLFDAYLNGQLVSSMQNYALRLSTLNKNGGFVEFPLAWHSDDATILTLSTKGIAFTQTVQFSFRRSGENISSIVDNKGINILKFAARGQFYKWVQNTHLPKIAEGISETETYMDRLGNRLLKLSLVMLFESKLHTVWQIRDNFILQPFASARIYYKFLLLKIWKNRVAYASRLIKHKQLKPDDII